MLLALLACVADPCGGVEGPVLRVWPELLAHRTAALSVRDVRTVAEALALAEPGTTICLAPGTWREEVALSVPDVALVGSGPELTRLEPPHPGGDPRERDDTLLAIEATGVRVAGVALEGARVGIAVFPGVEATVEDVELVGNGVGLRATSPAALTIRSTRLARNAEVGLALLGEAGDPEVVLEDVRLEGNGDASASPTGGVAADVPLVARGLLLSDNAGTRYPAIDARAGLAAEEVELRPPAAPLGRPRIGTRSSLDLRRALLTPGGDPAVEVRCDEAGGTVALTNVAVVDDAPPEAQAPALLALDGCAGSLVHVTVAALAREGPAAAVGDGLEIVNSAFVGFDAPLTGAWTGTAAWFGPLDEAALVRPWPLPADLRPQADSPLLDGGAAVGVAEDLDGRPRPYGLGPDIGAYERGP